MHLKAIKSILFTILILFGNLFFSAAQGKNFFISRSTPSWIVNVDPTGDKPSPNDINDGYYSSLLERQHHAELQEDYIHIIRQIVSDAGVQNGSEISVTYDPSYQKLIFHKIIVWRNNHPVDKLTQPGPV